MMRRVAAQLHVRPVSSHLQPCLRHFERRTFGADSLLQAFNVLLLVVNFLHGLGEVRLELVVSVRGLRDPLLEVPVGLVPVTPHVVSAARDQTIHRVTQAGALSARSWTNMCTVDGED